MIAPSEVVDPVDGESRMNRELEGGTLVKRFREDHDDQNLDLDRKSLHETYRVRRGFSGRQRTAKKPAIHGGIRQRRSKHWNW